MTRPGRRQSGPPYLHSHQSLNELCLKKEIIWMNSLIYPPRATTELFEKRNNLDELINIPTKAEERSMIQISFRTQDPHIKKGTILNPCQNSQLIHNAQYFQIPICAPFKANSVDPIHPLFYVLHSDKTWFFDHAHAQGLIYIIIQQ